MMSAASLGSGFRALPRAQSKGFSMLGVQGALWGEGSEFSLRPRV